MGLFAGSNQVATASDDAFATDSKPLTGLTECPKGKTLLKVHLRRIDTNAAIPDETVTAGKQPPGAPKTTAAQTGTADYGQVDPGLYTFGVDLSSRRKEMFKPYDPRTADVPPQVDFQATIKLHPRAKLKIVLFDKAGKKISGAAWSMKQPVDKSGTTGGDGLIDVEVPWDAADGDVLITLPDYAKVPAPAPVVPGPPPVTPPYPIAIDRDQFLPKEAAAKALPLKFTWRYQIDDLPDSDTETGWKARLVNIGFPCTDAPRTERSVKAFQRLHKKAYAGSGKIADVSGDLKQLHDTV